jgi:hypothetical protein
VNSQESVLKIRCSDGLTTQPPEIREKIVHEIRLPGGILFPDFCAFADLYNGAQTSEKMFHLAIEAIIDLKRPRQIILMAHTHCGAAMRIGLSDESVIEKHHDWQRRLQGLYPDTAVRVFYEKHSACGNVRDGHFEFPMNVPQWGP